MKNVSMINKDKLLRFIGILDETLGELKAISELDKAQVLSSRDRFAMENLFYRLAMVCIDMCFHVVAKKAGSVPGTYRECFGELVTLGILDPGLAGKLDELAGLRNVIAHAYWSIDYGLLYDFLGELEEIKRFRNEILALVSD